MVRCPSDLRGNPCFEATDGPVKPRLAEGLSRTIHDCRPGRTTEMWRRLRLRSGGGFFRTSRASTIWR